MEDGSVIVIRTTTEDTEVEGGRQGRAGAIP